MTMLKLNSCKIQSNSLVTPPHYLPRVSEMGINTNSKLNLTIQFVKIPQMKIIQTFNFLPQSKFVQALLWTQFFFNNS